MIFTCRRTSSPSSSAAAKTGGRRGEVGGGAGLGTEVLWAESHRAVAGGLTATSEGPPVVVDVSLASKTLYAAKNSSSVSFCVICSAADDSKPYSIFRERVTESFCVEDFVMASVQWLCTKHVSYSVYSGTTGFQ